jgi:tmRNA-binding protein
MKKRVLFEQKMINLSNKQHFSENKTEIRQLVLKRQEISLLPKCIPLFLGFF